MNNFINKLQSHIEHVKRVGEHCSTEETTKQALILPLLDILVFNPYDPTKVLADLLLTFPELKPQKELTMLYIAMGSLLCSLKQNLIMQI